MGSIREVLTRAERTLSASATPGADAEELASRALGLTRAELRLRLGETMDPAQVRKLEGWVERRTAGEPVQYITGRCAFRDLDLSVGPATLIPRPETEVLVESVLEVLKAEHERWPAPRVLDLGTGCGAIALAIASEHPAAQVTATDSSAGALDLARRNVRDSGLDERVRLVRGDWFGAVGADETFEVVVSNPPYIASGERDALPADVRGFEPRRALFSGPTGLEALQVIVEEAPAHLVPGGLLALELAEARAAEVEGWFEGARDWQGARVLDDLAGQPRVLLVRRQAGPAIAPVQWPEDR